MAETNLFSGEFDFDSGPPGFRGRARRIGDAIGAERIGATVYELPEGERVCPYHYHHGVEEWVLVLDGTPTVRTPDGEQTLRRGDVTCFPAGPAGAHAVAGPGTVVLISANRAPSISVYPDSDKLGMRPGGEEDRLNFLRRDAVEYLEGES